MESILTFLEQMEPQKVEEEKGTPLLVKAALFFAIIIFLWLWFTGPYYITKWGVDGLY